MHDKSDEATAAGGTKRENQELSEDKGRHVGMLTSKQLYNCNVQSHDRHAADLPDMLQMFSGLVRRENSQGSYFNLQAN